MENSPHYQEQQAQNVYLNQVIAQKAQLESDLKVQHAPSPSRGRKQFSGGVGESGTSSYTANVRITGWWRFKNVIVPPNVYVIHTRRGYKEPLHIGLGISFPFDPLFDSYLIVPATMQTILIHANCICKEKQGLVVQGYVQWIIDDISIAYRKLDFSDSSDPMRVVNVQLREQAEAAIKDKVATMSIDDVLTDKQPIIEELTARLRHVAEGEGQDKGLGVRIVTVQIKEAVVCSSKLWEMLQRPFRAERSKEARLAELASQTVVREKENEAEKAASRLRIETAEEVAKLEARAEASRFDRQQSELIRRAALEARTLEENMAYEKDRLGYEAEMEKLRLEKELMIKQMRLEAENRQAEKETELFAARRRAENDVSSGLLQERLIEHLPEIAEKLPRPAELKSISLGNTSPLVEFIAALNSFLKRDKDV